MDAWFDDRHHPVQPGHLVLVAPGGHKRYRRQGSNLMHHVVHFSYDQPATATTAVPELVDLGRSYSRVSDQLMHAVGWFVSHPQRAAVRLWDLLNQLADLADGSPTLPPAIIHAQRLIEQAASQAVSLAAIARACGYSPGHFSTLFKRHCGIGPAAWLRQRRMQRAEHLLTQSSYRIAAIAAEVGIPDLQHFNKTVRRHFGCSPRQVRERGVD